MSEFMAGRVRRWPQMMLGLVVMSSLAGCASMTQDVDAYYRQMEYNYKEAQDRAKHQVESLERQTSMLAATGDQNKLKRTQREIDRIKAWEAKCAKQEERFQKAAEWTEKRFHLEKAKIEGEKRGAPTIATPAEDSLAPPPLGDSGKFDMR